MPKGVYGILFLAVAVIVFATALQCRKRKEDMAGITGQVCLFASATVFFNSVTLLCNHPFVMSVAYSLQYVIIAVLMYLILTYTILLTESKGLSKACKIISAVFILADVALLLTNPWTGWALEYRQVIYHGDLYFEFVPRFGYVFHMIVSYSIALNIGITLIHKCIKVPFVYAGRYLLELAALVIIAVFNLLFIFTPLRIDVSCMLFAVTAFVAYRIALEYRPTFLRNQARYMMANKLKEPLVLFDIKERLADFNIEAAEKFGLQEKDLCHLSREYFETSILQLTYEENPDTSLDKEVTVQKEYAEIIYRLTIRNLQSRRGLYMGKMFVFQDITKQKMMYNALENMSSYDQLTGFYTSRIFKNKLEEWDKNAEEYIVAICNIAGMKLINAFYERKTGSSMIQKMSEELRAVLPEDALICYADDDCTIIVAGGITEEQMNLYLSNAARKLKKRGLDNVPVYLNYGVARRENTAVSVTEYIKYAVMDLLLKKGRDGAAQKREMTKALTEEYFRNVYESSEHVMRIKKLADVMAEKLGLSETEKEKLDLLCCYHDIGRVKTREEVWSRAAAITRDELDIVKLHSVTGYQIVREMQLKHDIAELVLYHHENYDGSGYPYGVSGEEIPLLARILAIIDSYDVMVNDQLYKGAVTEEMALEELRRYAGSQFDPVLVRKFEECLNERK